MTELLFDDVTDFYSEYLLMNTKKRRVFSRNFSLRVLQLSQLEMVPEEKRDSDLYNMIEITAEV